MTLLEIVNRVLLRLREDQVSDLSDSYSKLLAEYVTDIHREVAQAHDWSSMDVTAVLTVNVTKTTYGAYVGSPDVYSGTAPNRRSLLRFSEGEPVAFLYESLTDLANNEPVGRLHLMDREYGEATQLQNQQVLARPSAFSLRQDATNDGLTVVLDSVPDKTYYLSLRFFKPEADIDYLTDAARNILAPNRPIILGATYLALNERGEELGEPGNIAERKFYSALTDEIETDKLHGTFTNSYEMYRD